MANPDHVKMLQQGVKAWNDWRASHPQVNPDLSGARLGGAKLNDANLREADLHEAYLREAELSKADLHRADLHMADLREAFLREANLSRANLNEVRLNGANLSEAILRRAILSEAILSEAHLGGANLSEANLSGAILHRANLSRANLSRANLSRAHLNEAHLNKADLSRAQLHGADLREANLSGAFLREANLSGASLKSTTLVETDFTNADLTSCRVYGASAWGIQLSAGTKQQNLIITNDGEPEITVDNIEVAQFVYLLLNNVKIRDVIDTIGKKAVLILGRFTTERKAVLDALREALRRRDYLPILFDFDKPASKDLTGTILTLAHMARFIIADLTDPSCIPYEVSKIADAFVPVQPILLFGKSEFAMFTDLQRRFHWVLTTHRYDTPEQLLADLSDRVIGPAEAKAQELRATTVAPSLNLRTTP